MEQIKELIEKQNSLIEYQNKILIEGFDTLLRMIWFSSDKASNPRLREILDEYRNIIGVK